MVLIWGINFAVVKWALEAFDPLGFNALRHFFASLFMVPILASRGALRLPPKVEMGRVLVLGFIGVVAYQMLFIYGIDRTRAGNASLMLALVPLFLLIMGGSSADRTATAWVGALISISGVGLVSGSA